MTVEGWRFRVRALGFWIWGLEFMARVPTIGRTQTGVAQKGVAKQKRHCSVHLVVDGQLKPSASSKTLHTRCTMGYTRRLLSTSLKTRQSGRSQPSPEAMACTSRRPLSHAIVNHNQEARYRLHTLSTHRLIPSTT